jgi:hypothetical protein
MIGAYPICEDCDMPADRCECLRKMWCKSWWHKIRYGSTIEITRGKLAETGEYFCKKCGKKTGGYTNYGPFEFEIKPKQ